MSDSPIIIIPGQPQVAPPEPPDEGEVRYELGCHDGTGAARYVKLGKGAKLSSYFDDMFSHVLAMARESGGTGMVIAHGIQCLWCFTAKNVGALDRRIHFLSARVDDHHQNHQDQQARIGALEARLEALQKRLDDC